MIRRIISLSILLCSSFSLFGQNIGNNVTRDAHNNPNLDMTYANNNLVNVDLYNGVGNISIPIYNYSIDGLNLGVSLNYSTKGIKVDQVAGSVGLGWNLSIGSGMTRFVSGLEDDMRMDGFIGSFMTHPGGTGIQRELTNDIYSATLGGRSLEFLVYVDSNEIIFRPKAEVKILFRPMQSVSVPFTFNLVPRYSEWHLYGFNEFGSHLNFTLVDEKGNQFIFERGNYHNKKYYQDDTVSNNRWVTESWDIKKIITYTGAEIKYNYVSTYAHYPVAVEEKLTEVYPDGSTDGYIDIDYRIIKHDWEGHETHISSIEYPNGVTVYFDVSNQVNDRCDKPGSYVLNNIRVESAYDNNYKRSITYRLNHSYFHTPHASNSNTEISHGTSCNTLDNLGWGYYSHNYTDVATRLKLNSIDRYGTDTAYTERFYTFGYHGTPLPHRFSFQQDYYGFFNNGSVVPTPSTAQNFPSHQINVPYHMFNYGSDSMAYGVRKDVDTTTAHTYIQAGLLTSITNGMGGTTELKYKLPEAEIPGCSYREGTYKNDQDISVGGCGTDPELQGGTATDGLVVAEIVRKDGFINENETRTLYTYEGGQQFFRGGYYWYPTHLKSNKAIIKRLYTNFMVTAIPYFRGSNQGFSNTKVETFNNASNERLSCTKYEFSNLMVPSQLSDLFVEDVLDGNEYIGGYFPASGLTTIAAGVSNLQQRTGLMYHLAKPDIMETYLMGNVLEVEELDEYDNIKSRIESRYDLNVYNKDSTIYTGRQNAPQGQTYLRKNPTTGAFQAVQFTASPRYSLPAAKLRLRKQTTTKYSGTGSSVITYKYDYDLMDNLKSISWQDSKGDHYRKEFLHASADYNICPDCVVPLNHTVATRVKKYFPGLPANDAVINQTVTPPVMIRFTRGYDSTLVDTGYVNRKIPTFRFPSTYKFRNTAPVTSTQATADAGSAIASAPTGLTSIVKDMEYTRFDEKGNVLEVRSMEQEEYDCFVWSSKFGHKVAEISNARFDEIAYTSFEGFVDETGHLETDLGNWEFSPLGVVYYPVTSPAPRPMTGQYIYNLNIDDVATYPELNTKYKLSFWADIPPAVSLGGSSVQINQVISKGDMTLYTAEFTTGGTPELLSISDNSPLGSVGFIDEVRLLPHKASMKSYTYEPLFGVSSVCDERNNIMYTEYDTQGRASIIRDIDQLIRVKTETKYQANGN